MRRHIETDGAPSPVGPYSQAIATGELIFCAGQVGFDPATGSMVEGGIEAQAERVLMNLGAVLDAAGSDFANVLKTTCFLADLADYAGFNDVYRRYFPEPYPARSTFAVAGLPGGALVEIEVIAARR